MKIRKLFVLTTTILFLINLSIPVQARIKCWKNNEGIRECGTSIPPEFSQKSHTEISDQGMVKEEHARAKTSEELAEDGRLAVIEAEKEKIIEARRLKDTNLLNTYTKISEIEEIRDAKIAVIESRVTLTKKRSEKIQSDLDKRIQAAASAERAGKTPDEALLKDIESLRRQIKNNKSFLAERRSEQETVRNDYQADIDRFNLLTAKK